MANFTLWETLSNFYFTSSGALTGLDWSPGTAANNSFPIWVDDETSASTYVAGQPATYSIDLASQDWIGDIQPLIVVAQTTFVAPFGAGTFVGARLFAQSGDVATGGVFWWQASTTTPGAYDVEFENFKATVPQGPSRTPETVLSGTVTTIATAIANPLGWSYINTSAGIAFAYATLGTSSSTRDYYVEAVSAAGMPTSPMIEAATNVAVGQLPQLDAIGTQYYLDHALVDGASTGIYTQTFDSTSGALGASSLIISQPAFTSYFRFLRTSLVTGAQLVFTQGMQSGQQVLDVDLLNDLGVDQGVTASFDLTGTTADAWTVSPGVYDPTDGKYDYTALAYTDSNQVHLELIGADGSQVGSDFIVPGITSFDTLRTLGARVLIDYTVADPNGGTEIEGLIYDTTQLAFVVTLSTNAEYAGSPFDDTFTDAPGTHAVNGGGGVDTLIVNFLSSEVSVSMDSFGDVVVTTPDSVDTLQRFTNIYLTDATVTIAGETLTERFNDGSVTATTYGAGGALARVRQVHVDGSADVDVYTAGTIAGAAYVYKDVHSTASGFVDLATFYTSQDSVVATETFVSGAAPAIDLFETAASIEALTATQIAALGAEDVTTLTATDTSVSLASAQSAALQTANIEVVAPSGDSVREAFADGSVINTLFGANGTIARARHVHPDGTVDVDVYTPGVAGTASFAYKDLHSTPTGFVDTATFYNSQGAVVATEVFQTNGGFAITVSGVVVRSETVNADGSYELQTGGLTNQTELDYQTDLTASGALQAHSEDDVGNAGLVRLQGTGLTLLTSEQTIGPASAPGDFTFHLNPTETFIFAAGSGDVFDFDASGFGAATVKNFGVAGSGDIVDLAHLFGTSQLAFNAMQQQGANVLVTEGSDTITLLNVSKAALTASQIGF